MTAVIEKSVEGHSKEGFKDGWPDKPLSQVSKMALNVTITKEKKVNEIIGERHNAIMILRFIQYQKYG